MAPTMAGVRRRAAVAATAATGAALLIAPAGADAHALVGRQDLPIPAWLFAWGASLVLIVSFAGLTLACVAREAGEVERLLDEAERWLSGQHFELAARERETVSLDD